MNPAFRYSFRLQQQQARPTCPLLLADADLKAQRVRDFEGNGVRDRCVGPRDAAGPCWCKLVQQSKPGA